jgi:DtxR family transcriptional regulator, Mn-dependent transcriptional regulator
MENKLSPAMEDYLETIMVLKEQGNGIVRIRDIGNYMNVKNPTVNSAVNKLSDKKLVVHEKYGYVELTNEGNKVASVIEKKHNLLLEFLTKVLDIDEKTASEDACRMEHIISPKTFYRLTEFIKFINSGSYEESPEWLKNFKNYIRTGKMEICRMRKLASEKKKNA